MKRAVLAVLLVLVPSLATAKTPFTIGAESIGYGATSADKGTMFTNFWAGMRALEITEKTGAYICYQRVGMNGGLGGDGAKAVLISGSKIPGLYLVADIGVAAKVAKDGDGSLTTALTTGGGVAVALTEYIAPFIYGSAYDEGERFTWSIHCGLAVMDIQKMAGF